MSPPRAIEPPSGLMSPVMHFINVDFPAPLLPTSAVMTPFLIERVPSTRAWTFWKLFLSEMAFKRMSFVSITSLLVDKNYNTEE